MKNMYFKKRISHPLLRKIFGLTFASFVVSAASVSAQKVPAVWENQLYQPPFDLQAPGNRTQGGTRSGSQLEPVQTLTPLVPQADNFGVTTEAYPSFLVYAPQFAETPNLTALEFSLLDAEGAEVYRAKFTASLNQPVLRIDLPKYSGLQELEEGKDYLWILEGFTTNFNLSNNLVAHGWIRRVPQSEKLQQSIRNSTSTIQVADAYINEQIWYDAIAALEGEIQSGKASAQVVEQWKTLLNAAGIEDIALDPAKTSTVNMTPSE